MLGVRGSTPAPGPEFVRYGGHTSCISVQHEDTENPTLVLDAGTGLRSLTGLLGGAAFEGSILLSHLHWDHMMGLPFFAAGDRDEARVDVYLPAQDGRSGRDLVAQAMSPPAFPITPEGLRGTWGFHAVAPSNDLMVEGFVVRAVAVEHKGGATLAYRVAEDEASVAYLPDHLPAAGVSEELRQLLHGVDVLVHDAQFLDTERSIALDYGHATVEEALALARECAVGSLVLFHHGPARTDEALDAIGARATELAGDLPVAVAREGEVVHVTSPGRRRRPGRHRS